jgi:hypothetical protein
MSTVALYGKSGVRVKSACNRPSGDATFATLCWRPQRS